MKIQIYKISFFSILKGLSFPIFLTFFFLIIHIIEYYYGDFDLKYINISVIFILIFSSPSLILMVEHLFNNYNKTLRIDSKNKLIEIDEDKHTILYKENQIKSAILVKTLDDGWFTKIILLWSIFGYLRLEFDDGKIFYFSTLTFNKNKIWVWKLKTIEVFFPLIQIYQNQDIEIDNIPVRINNYKNKFKDYSVKQLKDIIDNKEKYNDEAVKACKLLIEEKMPVANN